jgi:hypothetical protein
MRRKEQKLLLSNWRRFRGSERLDPDLRILTQADCTAANEALDTARNTLPPAVGSDLERRVAAVRKWLTDRNT